MQDFLAFVQKWVNNFIDLFKELADIIANIAPEE